MALTDTQRLQMATMALMRYSVINTVTYNGPGMFTAVLPIQHKFLLAAELDLKCGFYTATKI